MFAGDADMARIAMGVLALLILWLVVEIARAVKRIGDDEHHMH
ncbi:conserved domain protein [Burkholderia pseudomallei 668]|nr:conserved domain protein [Burkholderia pseudomallei 668]